MSWIGFSTLAALVLSSGAPAGEEEITITGHSRWVGALAFSSNSKILASGSADRTIRLWDVAARQPLGALPGHKDAITGLVFSREGALISASLDRSIHYWDVKKRVTMSRIEPHRGTMIVALALSPAGILTWGSVNGSVSVVQQGQVLLFQNHKSWVNTVAFAGNQLLATGSSDGTIQLWEDKGGWKHRRTLDVAEGEVRSVAFSPNQTLLASGVRYGTIKVWNVDSGEQQASWKGHVSDVWSVAFSPDGKTLASGNGDWDKPGEVKLWDTTTWKETRVLRHTSEVLCVAFSPDGRYLAAGGWDGKVKLWRLAEKGR